MERWVYMSPAPNHINYIATGYKNLYLNVCLVDILIHNVSLL